MQAREKRSCPHATVLVPSGEARTDKAASHTLKKVPATEDSQRRAADVTGLNTIHADQVKSNTIGKQQLL